jgi:GAF domain-containing protein
MEHLEQQVADRTHDLQRRAIQLQAAAEVGHAAASLRNLDRLLPQVVQLISDRFGFYHAGVFLLDEVGEYASLRAANSEGGQQMLANQYKLKVGEQGIVGYVTSTGEPRIALDVGQDAVHFRNPYLPHTRSEMALPLVSGDRLVGALDVQSTEEAAFTREDVAVLQVLADQVAMAIENARIFEELQASLREVNTLYQRYVQGAWSREELSSRYTGYEYDRSRVSPYQHSLPSEFIRRLQAGRVVTLEPTEDGEGSQRSTLIVPIMLRGQTIGSIGFEVDEPERRWTPEELALVEAVTSQVALAMENARLFEEAQVQARLEQAVRQITEEMRRAVDVESILRKTVLRLGQTIGAPRAYVRLTLPAELPPGNGQEHLPPPPGQHEEG